MADRRPITRTFDETQIARLIRLEVLMEETRKSSVETRQLIGEKFVDMNNRLDQLNTRMDEQEQRYNDTYATKEELKPIRTLVYGAAGLILTSVFLAVIYIVIQRPPNP